MDKLITVGSSKRSVAGKIHGPATQQGKGLTDRPTPGPGKLKHGSKQRSAARGAHDGPGTEKLVDAPVKLDKLHTEIEMRMRSLGEDKAKHKRGKRSAPDGLGDGQPRTKQAKLQTLNPELTVEFKFLLSDPETVVEGLEKFVHWAQVWTEVQAEAGPGDLSSVDIVAGYCRSSPACSELFTLIDPSSPKMKVNELALVFRCLGLVLTRIRTDLFQYSSAGEAIVQKLLAGHMGQVYNCLQEQNKSKTIKAALGLLTFMVLLSSRAKKAVQLRLNFAHVNFPPIFRRRNRKDPEDVRSCVMLLTLSFLQDSDLSTISLLVQQKTFLQQVIGGLKYDRRDLVLETLATLLDKVVTFPGLTKTDKVKLFSETVLKQLCELYDWQGPSGWTPSGKKRKKEEETRVMPDGFAEDQEMVANVAHAFLLEVCCSHKHGLNFHDKSLGTGHRNHNQLLAHLVDWLVKKMDKPKVADLIIGILCACPDLMKATLTSLCPSLTPRWSDKWRQLMSWLTKLYRKLPDIPQFLSNLDYLKEDHISVVSMATVFCLPPTNVAAILTQGLKHEDLRVRDKCAHLVLVLAKKACAVREKLSLDVAASTAAVPRDDDILDLFVVTVLKSLPPTSQLFVCVDKTMQLMSARHNTTPDGMDTSVEDEATSSVDLSRHASVLLQVLGLYQTLAPSLLSDRPRDTAKLVDMVGFLQAHDWGPQQADASQDAPYMNDEEEAITSDHGWLPQLYLLKLLSNTDARKLSLGREGLLEKLLLSASQSHKVRDITTALICKMLQSMEVFSGHAAELHTWLDLAMSASIQAPADRNGRQAPATVLKPVLFLARCLASLINNPLPYVDRMMEAVAEAGSTDISGGHDMDSVSIGTSDSVIEAILMMEDEELDSKLDNCPPLTSNPQVDVVHLPISPLTVVALDNLQFGKSGNDTETEYVSKVLVHLLHSLAAPATLARLVAKTEAKLCEGVAAYLKYWTCEKSRKKSLTQPLPAAVFGKFTSALMSSHFELKRSNIFVRLSKQVPGMSNQDRLTALRQVLLYVRDTLQTSQKASCVETISSYLRVASTLLEHIHEEAQTHASNTWSWMKTLSTSIAALDDDDDDDVVNDPGAEVAVFDVLFSQFLSSSSASQAADGFKCVLLDPALKSWLFRVESDAPAAGSNKSPKHKNKLFHVVSISESVSEFVNNIITIARRGSWMKSESGLVDEYVQLALDGLLKQRLSARLEQVCGQILASLGPLLGLRTLSKCVVQLLELPLSCLLGEGVIDAECVKSNALTPSCRALCKLLKHLKLLLEAEPSFVGQQQMASLTSPGNELPAGARGFVFAGNRILASDPSCTHSHEFEKRCGVLLGTSSHDDNQEIARPCLPMKGKLDSHSDECGNCQGTHRLKGCVRIRTSFRFEDSSGQRVSSFAPVFLLLPHCENEHLLEFATFALNHVLEVASLVQPALFEKLFKNPLSLVEDSREQRLFASFISRVRGCFELYQQWLLKHVSAIIKRDKWFLLMAYLLAHSNFSDGHSQAVEAVKHKAASCLKTLDVARFSQSLPVWKLLSLVINKNDPQFQRLLVDTIMCHVRRHERCQQAHFAVLRISSGFCEWEDLKTPLGGQRSQAQLLDLGLDYLTYMILEGSAGDKTLEGSTGDMTLEGSTGHTTLEGSTDHTTLEGSTGHTTLEGSTGHTTLEGSTCDLALEEYLVDMAIHLVPQLITSDWTALLKTWQHLVQEALRHRLTDIKILKLLVILAAHLLPLGPPHLAAQHLFEQCLGHPMFHKVMTSEGFTDVKGELVKLLYTAGELSPSCYRSKDLESVLPCAYSASLSLTDQHLLFMMKRCSQSKAADFECPVLWGQAAVERQEVSEVLGPSLHKQASTQTILEQLNPALMQQSILNFPLRRAFSSDPLVEASEFKAKPDCYDPSFLLRLFRQILSSDKVVPMRIFVEKGCLSYLLIALSSHDRCTRLQAYQALNDFYLHAEASRWHDKMEITFVLDLLTASRVKDGQKLSFLVALFFARTVKLLIHPALLTKEERELLRVYESPVQVGQGCTADPMYLPVFRFLMAKPEVDLSSVPEFYRLFFSAGAQFKQERNWMLALLSDGIRETSDYWLYQKKFIFKIILTFYDSAVSDAHSQELILRIIKNACKEKSMAVDLVQNHGLMSWLVAAASSLELRPEHTGQLCDITQTLWHSLTSTRHLSQSLPPGSKSAPSSRAVASKVLSLSNKHDVSQEEPDAADDGCGPVSGRLEAAVDDSAGTDEDSRDDHQSSKQDRVRFTEGVSVQSLPKATAVEMGLLVKSLIPHLSKTSREGLVKVVQVLYGMISHDMYNIRTIGSTTATTDHDLSTTTGTGQAPDPPSWGLVDLCPLESCLLLYHVATAIQQPALVDATASVLSSTGINFQSKSRKVDRKSSTNETSFVSSDDHKVLDVEEERTESTVLSGRCVDEPQIKDAQNDTDVSTGGMSCEEARVLFHMLHNIVSTTRTVEFV